MKRGIGMGNVQSDIFRLACSVVLFFAAAASAHGASLCSDCHGMPPIDAPYRNITTGGFRGSHQTHNPAVAGAQNCEPCHTGSISYTSGHANGVISLAANINSSPVAAAYSKGVFFNQTSLPVLGTCASVNCHFEAVTPVWASAPLLAPAGCATCHGAPPSDRPRQATADVAHGPGRSQIRR